MATYGYARVSSMSQTLDSQVEALKNFGCDIIRSEKVSGTSMDGRIELHNLLDFIREGDRLVITRIDRLARSTFDLLKIVQLIEQKGASLHATEQSIATDTIEGRFFLNVLSAVAELETNLRKERQAEGIELAKKRGAYKGRKASIEADKIIELRDGGLGATAIAKTLGISRASVYRLMTDKAA
jgi:DNA invertase Pin-like site-specific DNA recombinase